MNLTRSNMNRHAPRTCKHESPCTWHKLIFGKKKLMAKTHTKLELIHIAIRNVTINSTCTSIQQGILPIISARRSIREGHTVNQFGEQVDLKDHTVNRSIWRAIRSRGTAPWINLTATSMRSIQRNHTMNQFNGHVDPKKPHRESKGATPWMNSARRSNQRSHNNDRFYEHVDPKESHRESIGRARATRRNKPNKETTTWINLADTSTDRRHTVNQFSWHTFCTILLIIKRRTTNHISHDMQTLMQKLNLRAS